MIFEKVSLFPVVSRVVFVFVFKRANAVVLVQRRTDAMFRCKEEPYMCRGSAKRHDSVTGCCVPRFSLRGSVMLEFWPPYSMADVVETVASQLQRVQRVVPAPM